MTNKSILTLVITLCYNCIFAQNQNILRGIVIDSVSALPLENVSILIKENQVIKYFTKTNKDGIFNISCNLKKNSVAEASYLGYTNQSIYLNDFFDKTITFRLDKSIKKLDSIKVESKIKYLQKGDTLIIKAANYYKGDEENLGELLKKIPRVEVSESGFITIAGKNVNRIFIDGKDILGADYQKLVNNLTPKNITEFQFIENFKDENEDAYIIQENVLNIKFKQKSILKGGKLSTSKQSINKNAQFKGDVLLSGKKINGFHFANLNQIGETAGHIVTEENSMPIEMLISLSKINLNNENDNGNIDNLKPKNYLKHSTLLIDNNQNYFINKSLKVKQQVYFASEKLIPQSKSEDVFFINGLPLAKTSVINSAELSNLTFNTKSIIDYKIKNRSRIKINIDFNFNKKNINSFGFLNTQTNILGSNKKSWNIFFKSDYKRYVKKVNYLTLTFNFLNRSADFFQNEIGREFVNFNNTNSLVNDVNYKNIFKENNISLGLGYTIRSPKKNRDLSFSIQSSNSIFKLENNFEGKDLTQNIYNSFDDFTKSSRVRQFIFSTPILFQNQTKKNSTNILLANTLYLNQSNKSTSVFTYNFNQNFNLTKRNTLSFSSIKSVEQPLINLYSHSIFLNKSSALVNYVRNFYLLKSHVFSINFMNSHSLRNYSSINLSYISKNNDYILNEFNNNFFRVLKTENFNGRNFSALSIKASLSTTLFNDKSSFLLSLSQSFSNDLQKQSNLLLKSKYINTIASLRLKTEVERINFQYENSINFSKSKSLDISQGVKFTELVNKLEVKYNISNKVFISFESIYFLNISNNKRQVNEFLLNTSVKHNFKNKKFKLTYFANNLTNNKEFNRLSQSIFYKQNNSIPLIPINIQVKLDYLF